MAGTISGTERSETARAIHTALNEAASAINDFHAQVLAQVIKAQAWKVHRDVDGFSALRDWLVAKFDFHHRTAADLAAIARLSRKFTVLTEAATSGAARIDQVAYTVRALDKTPAMRLYARTPYRQAVASPFNPAVSCPTPEDLAAQYCQHATHADLARHLAEIEAACADQDELFEGLSEQALARLEVWETDNGMWAVDGLLTSDTGAMFAKLLTTAVPPPRQEDCETDNQAGTDSQRETETSADGEGGLPAAANRNAEALHQMLASFGADAKAPTRHGHTATLSLAVDIDTLRGEDTGRTPTLEGTPISVAKARLLACEARIIPSVFDYTTGEAIELGREQRLPNAALRRKLEAEQPDGCAWHGCARPIQWTEAHHLVHWANGGATVAENLILLCRLHHGRIHTPGWSITKTGPGQALIVHHHDHEPTPADMTEHEVSGECGCADWRTDIDLDTDFQHDASNLFPLGLFPEEHAPKLKDDLNRAAEQAETETAWTAVKIARAKARARFATPAKAPTGNGGPPEPEHPSKATTEPEPHSGPEPARTATDRETIPFLPHPAGRPAGDAHHTSSATRTHSKGFGPSPCPPPWLTDDRSPVPDRACCPHAPPRPSSPLPVADWLSAEPSGPMARHRSRHASQLTVADWSNPRPIGRRRA